MLDMLPGKKTYIVAAGAVAYALGAWLTGNMVSEAVTDAKIDKMKTGQAADIAWENLSITNSGWKDEFLLIIFSVPLVMSFIPGLQPFVAAGFVVLDNTPLWYQSALGVMIASAYGVKKFTNVMHMRKGD